MPGGSRLALWFLRDRVGDDATKPLTGMIGIEARMMILDISHGRDDQRLWRPLKVHCVVDTLQASV